MTYTYPRWQKSFIQHALKTRRVVTIGGARQCGKTTLARSFVNSKATYRTLDDRMLLEAAKTDPQAFVLHFEEMLIIDEVQKALELLPAIKMAVDENSRKGQYLLTGSAHIASLPGVTESLAGRICEVPLRPLAQGEILNNQPIFLIDAFEQKFLQHEAPLSRDDIIEIAMRGGYPEPLKFTHEDRQLWHRNYIDLLLDRDLREIINIRRRDALFQLIQVISAWSTKRIDISAIGSGLSLQRHTLESYLNALEALYLIDRIPAFAKTEYDRVGLQAKLLFNDSGLMASILRWRLEDIRFDGDKVGKLIETHVGNELQKQVDTTRQQYSLYHYRDREKREIDFLIENAKGDLLGIEVKASTGAQSTDFNHLKAFKERIKPRAKSFIGIVLYTGPHIASFGENLWAVPISCLY
ncbi:MAG: hypothetical protein A3F18_06075 [Legionellales bacterium RIFCSPHIGHO2_12_FULL_37_14]|nr:MAG: hypothetical protein A3F18_06075 [Legionellales bacterium RIFCSPHIGHO2_12_FULL_37_14]